MCSKLRYVDYVCYQWRAVCAFLSSSLQLHVQGTDDPLLELAAELEKVATTDEYFVTRNLYPNVDFYSGICLRAMGIPVSMFTVLFAMARTVGWVAQWKEMASEKVTKIGRPRQV